MGKCFRNHAPSFDAPRHLLFAGYGILVFPAMALLVLLLGLPGSQAASPAGTGLSISGADGNINVALDHETAAMASIRRNEERMLIRLPHSASIRAAIDPELRKNGLVRESDMPEGRTIAIYSQRIYMNADQNAPTSANHPAAGNSAGLAAPQIGKSSPAMSVAFAGLPLWKPKSARSAGVLFSMASPKPDAFWKHLPASAGPESIPGMEAAMAELRREIQATDALDLRATASPRQSISGSDPRLSQSALPPAEEKATPAHPPTSSPGHPEDPESRPVRWPDDPASGIALPTGGAEIPRILFGLIAVLTLVAGFLKWALPRLVERYPDFFEHLKRWSPDAQASRDASPPSAAASRRSLTTRTTVKKSMSLPMEKTEADDPRFEILSSTPLEADKNLHLVSIQGKRMVVATTPYMVTVLREVDSDPSPEEPDDRDADGQEEAFAPPRKGLTSRPTLPGASDRRLPSVHPSNPQNRNDREAEEVVVLDDYDDQWD